MTKQKIRKLGRKDCKIEMRVTREKKQRIVNDAKEAGMTITDYMLASKLGETPRIKKADPDRAIKIRTLAELGKIGSNLNQIAKVMNTDKKNFYTVWVKETLIVEALKEIKAASSVIIKEFEHDSGERANSGQWSPTGELPTDKGR